MGIEVSATKFVTINDQHQHGVNTLVASNPTRGRLAGIRTLHVFKRNHMGHRHRDDGNPLIHALKGTRGYQIQPYWRGQFDTRATQILTSCLGEIQEHDYLLPIPSSSPFCGDFTTHVSQLSAVPILPSDFLAKRTIGEVLADIQANPPKVKKGLQEAFEDELHVLQKSDPDLIYTTKKATNRVRTLFRFFKTVDDVPDIAVKKILIVDDLLATGSSLFSIREILQNQHGAEVSFLSYLSGS